MTFQPDITECLINNRYQMPSFTGKADKARSKGFLLENPGIALFTPWQVDNSMKHGSMFDDHLVLVDPQKRRTELIEKRNKLQREINELDELINNYA